MEDAINLMDIDNMVQKFLEEHQPGIATMHRLYFKNDNVLSLQALTVELAEELKNGCVTFFNKDNSIEELDPYLFYIANAVCKKLSTPFLKKKTDFPLIGISWSRFIAQYPSSR